MYNIIIHIKKHIETSCKQHSKSKSNRSEKTKHFSTTILKIVYFLSIHITQSKYQTLYFFQQNKKKYIKFRIYE